MKSVMGLSAALLLSWMAQASAEEIIVRAPFVNVRVNTGATKGAKVDVQAPFTRVIVPSKASAKVVKLNGAEPLHSPKAGKETEAVKAISHGEFAKAFTPKEGKYEVVLIHPYSGCPVNVCFSLPCGCPKKVRVECGELEFDYGCEEVEIRFKRDGRVKVEYND